MKKTTSTILFLLLIFNINAQITPREAIEQMARGINIGNTLDAPREGEWYKGTIQEYFFDDYKEAGFTCVRIPVRWDKHMETSAPYTVDEIFLNRVEQVIDWGLSRGLFIIINSHHDNWIKENYSSQNVRDRFDAIWTQVSGRF